MSIYSKAVKNPVTTALIFTTIVILGIFSYRKLAVDLLPAMDETHILVMTTYAGASASDVENNVTKPIENAVNGVSDLKHIMSFSRENISIVGLEFEYGVDINVATNDVRDMLNMVSSILPDDSDQPVLMKFGTDNMPIMILSVTAEESMNSLYKILDDKVANPLARISGVGSVSIGGTAQRVVNVYCDPHKLNAYGLSVEGIAGVIAYENRNVPGGNLHFGNNTYNLRVEGEFVDSQDMLDLVLSSVEGRNVYLRDVARIEDSVQESAQESYNNGTRGGMIIVQKQSGANSVEIANKIKEMLPTLQESLPSDVQLGVIIDTSRNILNTMGSLQETILITMLIVTIVVFVFLGRWRATLIILVTIPISLIAAFIYLLASGNTLNIISLSSLSLAIGMVVDDAIVVLENITKHIERGSKPKQAAVYGTSEVSLSVIASTLTMLAVFLPLTMVSGITGVLFRQLGWIVSVIMIVSTFAALTLIPMMCSKMLKLDTKKGRLYTIFFTPIEKALAALDRFYGKVLSWSVRHRKTVIAGAVVIFVGVMSLSSGLKTEFIPAQDSGRVGMTLELPVGTRQEVSQDVAQRITKDFMARYPEIVVINYSVGQADEDNIFANLSDNGSHIISYNIDLGSIENRKRGMQEIVEDMRVVLLDYPELSDTEVISGGLRGMGGEVSVDFEVYGYNFSETDVVVAELSKRLLELPECSEVNVSRGDYTPEIQVEFDREKLALHGLNLANTSMALRNRVNGAVASYYREDGEEYDIRVRFAPEFRETIEDIENIMVYTSKGEGVRIRDLGKVVEKMSQPTIERKDRERFVTVSAVVAQGYAMSELVDKGSEILNRMELPSDVHWGIGGIYETQQDTFNELFALLALIIILVFVVMACQFESLTDPFVIMFSIPFAFCGVVLGLRLTDTTMGVMAMIGVLILMGVVVKNGIVLVDYIILSRERGMGITAAVIAAGKSRLRPVLMTTLTTVLGMLPMALGTGEGAEVWRSMGMTVAWGLSFSTLITLILVPVLYCVFAGNGINRRRKKGEKKLEVLEQL